MPPKPKFTREEIVAAALQVVRTRGLEALTTRGTGHVHPPHLHLF